VRHRSDNIVDKKSKPSDEMPDWWISSSWVPLEESDNDDDDDDDELFIDIINRNNNDNRNNDNNDDNDNNNNNNAPLATAALTEV
jgi:serine/threonine-protein kinase RIM15